MAIFRVTVRGRFVDLDDERRARLRAELAAHDLLASGGFTEEGFLAYDQELRRFTFRVQLRSNAEDAELEVRAVGELRTMEALDALGVPGEVLKVLATDMASVWAGEGRG